MWFYSSPEGFVYRTDAFTSKTIAAKLSNYASPDELVGVVKKVRLIKATDILIFFTSFSLNTCNYPA